MNKYLAILFALIYVANTAIVSIRETDSFDGNIWVVLCAGAKDWFNYEMQSSVYHAYHFFRNNGIPDERIIVMHFDDIANYARNPTPGVIINEPNGTDVYHGVPKHYTGVDVTPENFLGVIKGDKQLEAKGKKVLKSGPKDHVFIHFNDHGGNGEIMFPKGYLKNTQLNDALKYMYENKMFAKLVFYLEACESGSMFDKLLPNNINVYAVTATMPGELGWMMFCRDDFEYCLADHFTYHWLNHSEHNDLDKVTLQQQYDYLKSQVVATVKPGVTHLQHSQQYGDLSIGKLPASQFMGKGKTRPNNNNIVNNGQYSGGSVLIKDIAIYSLQMKIQLTDDINEKLEYSNELNRLLSGRKLIDKHFEEYVNTISHLMTDKTESILNTRQELTNRKCYQQLVDTCHEKCFNQNQNPYVLTKLHIFVNICQQMLTSDDVDIDTNTAVKQLIEYCNQNVDQMTNIL